MNKPQPHSKREGFVRAQPIADPLADDPVVANGPVIDNEPVEPEPEPAPEPAPEPYKDTWPIKVKLLHKPIRGPKGNLIQELTFREPTGGDINRYGNPCHVNQEGDVLIIERKMMTMMAVLSGVLQPFVEAMDPRDWNSCAYRLRSFFIPNPEAW